MACSTGPPQKGLVIGAIVATIGNLLISFSFQIQKYAHNRNTMRAGGPLPYTKIKLWWLGLLCMAFGEVGNFLAYGYAPATLVSPLGAVSVISNAILAHFLLKEPLFKRTIVGVFFALCGAIIIVLCTPTSCEPALTVKILLGNMEQASFLVFISFVIAGVIFIIHGIKKRIKERYVLFYVTVCGLLGAITVMSAKGVSTALNDAFKGNPDWFESWLLYILIASAATSIVLQMKYLNLAMITFGASEVVPVYYVMFVVSSMVSGMVLYRELHWATVWQNVMFFFGIGMTFGGVYLINTTKKRAPIDSVDLQSSLIDNDSLESEKDTLAIEEAGHLAPKNSPDVRARKESMDGDQPGARRRKNSFFTLAEDAFMISAETLFMKGSDRPVKPHSFDDLHSHAGKLWNESPPERAPIHHQRYFHSKPMQVHRGSPPVVVGAGVSSSPGQQSMVPMQAPGSSRKMSGNLSPVPVLSSRLEDPAEQTSNTQAEEDAVVQMPLDTTDQSKD